MTTQVPVAMVSLKYCDSVWWRTDGAVNVERRRCQQERPLLTLGTLLRQSLQIPQFTNWHTKQTEEVLVQNCCKSASICAEKRSRKENQSKAKRTETVNAGWFAVDNGRDGLESDGIACNGRKVLVPEPFGGLGSAFDATRLVRSQSLLLLLAGQASQRLGEAGAYDDDVALLEGDALLLGHGLQLGDGDALVGERRVGDAVGVGVSLVVDQHAAAHQAAALVPVVQGRQLLRVVLAAEVLLQRGQRRLRAVVRRRRGLVVEVAQRVPLAAALRVEFHLVVEAVDRERRVHEVHHLVHQPLSTEPGRVDGSDWPAAGNRVSALSSMFNRQTQKAPDAANLEVNARRAYFSDTETPSLTSATASRTTLGVSRFNVPYTSFFPPLSKTPQAQPFGMPLTSGRSSKSGTFKSSAIIFFIRHLRIES